MLLLTTLFIAAITIAALYFTVVRNLRWPLLSYGLMVSVGIVCLFGSMHFAFIGFEIAILGSLIVWLHHRFWLKKQTSTP